MAVYDYVVIGAGSAGCAVAGRLSERDLDVAIVEAGPPDEQQEIHVPAAFPMLFKSPLDWDYETEPQKQLNARQDYWPRGRVFGGSSSINAQIYQRGAHADWDGWAAMGNTGWGWDDVLPIFKRAENQERGPDEWHGVGGPMNVADLRDPNPLTHAFVAACTEQSLPLNNDFNAATQEGFGIYQVTQKGGLRWSAARGYLHPALERPNCTAIANAHVLRLIFEDGSCTGAVYWQADEEHTIQARREVILCGGAINSPQLLLLSGIGPRQQLEALGIDVVRDLPGVGQNLQDHVMVPTTYESTQPITLADAGTEEQRALFAEKQIGLLSSNIAEAGGFITLFHSPAPELQFHFVPGWSVYHGAGNPPGHGISLVPTMVGTRSVGSMWLRSADPFDKPALDPNYLDDDGDMEILIQGTRLARQIMQSPAFDEFRGPEHLPGAPLQSDDDIREHVRNYATGIYHPVGTCKMGTDPMAVVGPDLRVHGIEGLRVADASIMPTIVNANTNNPCIIIGEKCSDLVMAS